MDRFPKIRPARKALVDKFCDGCSEIQHGDIIDRNLSNGTQSCWFGCIVGGEEIIDEREVQQNGHCLCRACAGASYYVQV
jgi:hypothetical protein